MHGDRHRPTRTRVTPRHAALAALGSILDYNKCVIVVDNDVDVHDLHDVWVAFGTRGRADTRTTVIADVPGFYRDPQQDDWGKSSH